MTTDAPRSVLGFELVPFEDGPALSVVPVIDGRSLVDIVFEQQRPDGQTARQYIGLVPGRIRLGELERYYLGHELATPGMVIPLICECGELGCKPLHMRATVAAETVTWSDFVDPGGRHRPDLHFSEIGPFVFDRSQYVEAVRAMAAALEEATPGVLDASRRAVPSEE